MELSSLNALQAEAARLATSLAPKESGATLVTLSGELGAGKTSFVQGVARALGVTGSVTSPTFVLMKLYPLPQEAAFKQLVHVDAYRLESGAELSALGFDEVMKEPGNLVLFEWPERVGDALPQADVAIRLTVVSDESRMISYV